MCSCTGALENLAICTNPECLVHVLLYPWDTQGFLNIFSPRREALQWAAVPESLVGQWAWAFPGRAGTTKGSGLCHCAQVQLWSSPCEQGEVPVSLSRGFCGTPVCCRVVKFGSLLWAAVKHFLNHIRRCGNWPASIGPSLCSCFREQASHCFT